MGDEDFGKYYQHLQQSREIIFNCNEPELSILRNQKHTFSHFSNPIPKVSALSEALQLFPPEDVLKGDILFYECQPDVYKEVLLCLRPDNCNFMLSYRIHDDKELLGSNNNGVYHKEPYYHTQYSVHGKSCLLICQLILCNIQHEKRYLMIFQILIKFNRNSIELAE